MYTIHFDKRRLIICPNRDELGFNPNSIIYNSGESCGAGNIADFFDKSKKINLLYIPVSYSHVDKTFKQICSGFRQINAGGGLVTNKEGEVLLILRNGIWDLPKGKQEPNEDIRDSALREVKEECGIDNIDMKELICITRHCYHQNGYFILKHTYWYKMYYKADKNPNPQREEHIEECKWVNVTDLPHYLENTYPSIKEVFNKAGLIKFNLNL